MTSTELSLFSTEHWSITEPSVTSLHTLSQHCYFQRFSVRCESEGHTSCQLLVPDPVTSTLSLLVFTGCSCRRVSRPYIIHHTAANMHDKKPNSSQSDSDAEHDLLSSDFTTLSSDNRWEQVRTIPGLMCVCLRLQARGVSADSRTTCHTARKETWAAERWGQEIAILQSAPLSQSPFHFFCFCSGKALYIISIHLHTRLALMPGYCIDRDKRAVRYDLSRSPCLLITPADNLLWWSSRTGRRVTQSPR